MQIQMGAAVVQKEYVSRRRALNTFEALYPDFTPNLQYGRTLQDEEVFFAHIEKDVAFISGVEYTVVKVEDPKEGIENAE